MHTSHPCRDYESQRLEGRKMSFIGHQVRCCDFVYSSLFEFPPRALKPINRFCLYIYDYLTIPMHVGSKLTSSAMRPWAGHPIEAVSTSLSC